MTLTPGNRTRSVLGGAANPLPFVMQYQQQTQWCWSANAVSVDLFYAPGSTQTQCALVNSALGQSSCCQSGSSSACNQPWFLDRALSFVGHLHAMTNGKAALATVQSEITGGRPFCLRIGWNGGGGHFVAIYGYAAGNLNIGDPWYGNSFVAYSSFPATYQGGGSWTHNYTTKP